MVDLAANYGVVYPLTAKGSGGDSDAPGVNNVSQHENSVTSGSLRGSEFVQLEIHVETIKRLILERGLVGEELRCLNNRSKNALKQTFLDCLSLSTNPGRYSG